MKYYIIAGEASGDLHASNLMIALTKLDANAQFRVWGGDKMIAAGGTLQKHYRDLAFMGFLEVVKNLKTILGNLRFCKEDILNYKPDALILVDYPGFNLRIAEWANTLNLTVYYYISPQIWAWNTKRVYKIKKIVNRMFVILPFEQQFYAKYNYNADFVGHPLLDEIDKRVSTPNFRAENQLDNRPIIALLPGSRKQEINRMLSIMLQTVAHFPDYQFVVAGAPAIDLSYYKSISGNSPLKFVENKTYDLLEHATAALVTSGTATLETALFNVPQVVCYKGNHLSYLLARRLVKVKYISLVNLIADQEVVKELIQDDFTVSNLKLELTSILQGAKRDEMLQHYNSLKEQLGGVGASQRTARLMHEALLKG